MAERGRPAAFLDRDGTLIVEAYYLADPDGLELVEGAAEAVRRLRDAGLAVVVVTNQSGIARGLYTEKDYHAVAARLQRVLEDADSGLDGQYYCPHHPDHTGPCGCRKPGPDLYERAARDLDLSLADSYYVGDKHTDVEAAARWGGKGILVRTGYGRSAEATRPADVWVADDIAAAADLILAMEASVDPPQGLE